MLLLLLLAFQWLGCCTLHPLMEPCEPLAGLLFVAAARALGGSQPLQLLQRRPQDVVNWYL